MIRNTSILKHAVVLAALSLSLTGCQYRYFANRHADFHDIFQIGVGYTTENPKTGVIPPSLGAHIQVTEFLNLGWIHFTGKTAELDGRGSFCGSEQRTRLGFGPYQRLYIDQDYANGKEDYFKKYDTLWNDRMHTPEMSWGKWPAKQLNYEDWSMSPREASPLMPRGYQYWENLNAELCISEPFITHFGLNFRFGFDPSEIFDFILGVTTFDFKRDDLTPEEHTEMLGPQDVSKDFKPASD